MTETLDQYVEFLFPQPRRYVPPPLPPMRISSCAYDVIPPTCLCGKSDIYSREPYHSLSCSELRYRGTNYRHRTLVDNMATWIARTGAHVWVEVRGLSDDDNKTPDIVFHFNQRQYVIDVTVTDPFNSTNSKRVSSAVSTRSTASLRTKRSLTFDTRANRYDIIHEVADKWKNRHYRKLIENMRKQYPGHDVQFITAGAFTTGGLETLSKSDQDGECDSAEGEGWLGSRRDH